MASTGLEAFIDESIRLSRQRGYNPTTFIVMRARLVTIPKIEADRYYSLQIDEQYRLPRDPQGRQCRR
jgi:hypothetical protein